MDRTEAIKEIDAIFATYKTLSPSDTRLLTALTNGKLYELYVLSHVVENLRLRGFHLVFKGNTLKFKSSPGRINRADPHFEVIPPGPSSHHLWLFVDIEFETLGTHHVGAADRSRRHEIDIVVVGVQSGYPAHTDIALGVECKAVSNFRKSIVKEVLGVRRELSLLTGSHASILSALGGKPSVDVPADPPSEYWLAYIDPAGNRYSQSPGVFGVAFKHLEP